VVAALADLALRRPWALLAANLAVLAAAVLVALGAPDRLGIGSLRLDEGAGRAPPDFVIATTGKEPVHSAVYRVALRVISSQVRSDPQVDTVRQGPVSRNGRSTSLIVALRGGDEGERQQAAQRLEEDIDPGPLRVDYGGEVATLLEARHNLEGDLWRLELLAVPLTALVLGGILGVRLDLAPMISAATAIAGALAGLRLIGGFADLSLLGIAPAAVLGLALGVEVPCLMVSRFGDEVSLTSRFSSTWQREALQATIAAGARVATPLGLAAVGATAGLLATSLDQGPSMVIACALAVALAIASALVSVPPLLVLRHRVAGEGVEVPRELRTSGGPRALGRWLARSRLRTGIALLVAIAALVAAASPAWHGRTHPFSAFDLPAGSEARTAAALVGGAGGKSDGGRRSPDRGADVSDDQSLFPKLPVAAAVSVGALLLVLLVAFRSAWLVPVAVVTLLPAAAAAGLCVLLFQDGHLAGTINQQRQGSLETGALASLLAALAALSAARAVAVIEAVRAKRSLAHWLTMEPGKAAEAAAFLTMPAAVAATLIAAAAAGVLAGSDLYSAREFGLAVAAGLLLDLVLLRLPLLAALVRWGRLG
jgi:uncharacterized membrane protein YdfJ with MMPL/SSD domain